MKAIFAPVLALFLAVTAVSVQAASAQQTPSAPPTAPAAGEAQTPPSEVSVRQLLEVMQARKMVERMNEKVDAMFTSTMKNMLQGKTLTPEQQQRVDDARARMGEMMKEAFNWEALEPMYLEVYSKTFSQSEVDSMTAFYSSPAGQAVVAKLPLAMENSMAFIQQRMLTLLPKMQQVAKDTAEQIKAQHSPGAKSAS
jgi:uncharacterized protein